MRKRTGFLALVLAATMTLGTSITAFAEDFTVKDGQQFEFDSTAFNGAGVFSGHAVLNMYSISLEETTGNGVDTLPSGTNTEVSSLDTSIVSL